MQTKADSLLSRLPLGLLASPERFYLTAGRLVPWVALAGGLLTAGAVATGILMEPVDSQQGSAWRIVFVHVPAAWMSLFLYLGMAFFAVLTLALAPGLPAMLMTALAPTGAVFTLIALGTGSLWGKPIWNAWWVWDARLTSELILLFLYIGFLALGSAISDRRRADRACAVLVLVGVINIPNIYLSVRWWNTLHQGSSGSLLGSPAMPDAVFAGMLVMAAAFLTYAAAVVLARVRCLIVERDAVLLWLAKEETET
jgi:heme exporter protein C